MIKRARAVIIYDKRILLITWPGTNIWSTPGGRVENGETSEQALRREIKEELGAEITNIRKYFSYDIPEDDGTPSSVECFFADIEDTLKAQSEISDARWISKLELADIKMTGGLQNYLLPQLMKDNLI